LQVKVNILLSDVCQFPEDGIFHEERLTALPRQAVTTAYGESNQLFQLPCGIPQQSRPLYHAQIAAHPFHLVCIAHNSIVLIRKSTQLSVIFYEIGTFFASSSLFFQEKYIHNNKFCLSLQCLKGNLVDR